MPVSVGAAAPRFKGITNYQHRRARTTEDSFARLGDVTYSRQREVRLVNVSAIPELIRECMVFFPDLTSRKIITFVQIKTPYHEEARTMWVSLRLSFHRRPHQTLAQDWNTGEKR